jgi:hypothetical protein
VRKIYERLQLRRQVQLRERWRFAAQNADGGTQSGITGVDVHAQAAQARHLDGGVHRAAGAHVLELRLA